MKKLSSFLASLILAFISHGLGQVSLRAQANDHFANAIVITTNRAWVTATNIGASKEAGEPNHARNRGGRSVWWTWTATESGFIHLTTWPSYTPDNYELDTLLAVYTGDQVNALTELASNDDSSTGWTSELRIPVTAGTVYRIAVDGYDTFGEPEEGVIWLFLNFYTTGTGVPAPAWNVPNLEGQRVSSTNFAGQVVLLNFWATWCVPCIQEIPDLIYLHEKYSPDGFSVIGVSIDDAGTESSVRSFAQSYQMNFPILFSRPEGTIELDYGDPPLIPTTFVIDRNNRIVEQVEGLKSRAYYEDLIKRLLYQNMKATSRVTEGGVAVSWPSTVAPFSLEWTSNLLNPQWTPVPGQIEAEGTNRTVRLPPGEPAAFFRLRLE